MVGGELVGWLPVLLHLTFLRVTSGKAAFCGEAVVPDRARRPPRARSVTVTHRSSALGQAPSPFPLTLGSRNPQPPLPL